MFKSLPVHDRSRTRSPIRSMGTGYEKIAQVLVDALVSELREGDDEKRKLVLFSDSRQDAAKLSAGLEKRHYQDLVRRLLVGELMDSPVDDVELCKRFIAKEDHSVEARAARDRIRLTQRDLYDALEDSVVDGDDIRLNELLSVIRQGRPLTALAVSVETSLVRLGINPAGPDPRRGRRKIGDGKRPAGPRCGGGMRNP